MAKLLDADIYKPVKEWVGLSDDELELILLIRGLAYKTLAEKIEAKLREKNG